jgi:hypothetical protein
MMQLCSTLTANQWQVEPWRQFVRGPTCQCVQFSVGQRCVITARCYKNRGISLVLEQCHETLCTLTVACLIILNLHPFNGSFVPLRPRSICHPNCLGSIIRPHCSIFSHLPHHPPAYCRLPLLDAIAMDNHMTAKCKDSITMLLSKILENVAAIVVRTSPTPLIDTMNLHRS